MAYNNYYNPYPIYNPYQYQQNYQQPMQNNQFGKNTSYLPYT